MTTMTFGRYIEFIKNHPKRDRIMCRNTTPGYASKIEVRICHSRESLARQIRRQETRAPHWNDWRPCIKLIVSEGFK